MFLLQRTPTASFATSDLAGTWNLSELHVFEDTGNVGAWTRGTLTVNASGVVTGGTIVAPDGSFHNPTGGAFTITTGVGGGQIVGTITTATATISGQSIMHGTKDLIFGIDTTAGTSVTHGLVVLSKVPSASPSTLQFNAATYTVSEAAGSVIVRVTRSGSKSTAAHVAYATVAGTACSCTDFEDTAGVLTFPAGETFQDITVPIIDDTVVDGSRSFTVVLSSPAGATLGSPSTTTVTITNNDAAGSFKFGATSYSVTEGGTVKARIQRTLGAGMALASGVTVTYSVLGSSTATNSADYTIAGGGTLTFAAGQSFRDVTISALDDTLTEGPETIQLMLVSSNIGSIILPKTTTVTIADVVPSRIQFATSAMSVPESAGTVKVVVTRTGSLAGAVFVPLGYGGTGIAGVDYATPPGGITFGPGQASRSLPITVLNDTHPDGSRTLVITLGTPGGTTVLGTPRSMTLTIGDDEATIQFTGRYRGNFPEVRRTGNLSRTSTVHYKSTGGTATSGLDFVPLDGILTFPRDSSLQYIPLVIRNDTTSRKGRRRCRSR